MASEAKRGLIRIAANYSRLVTNIFLGLLLVPMLLQGVGNEGWALIALLGSMVGLASMAQEIVRSSLIRELGAAYHSERPGHFRSIYNSGLAISAVIAVVAAALFGVLWLLVPLLQIPAELVGAGRWLVATRGAETFTVLLLAAPFNMYKVTERMVAYNAWLLTFRCCYVGAAAWMLLGSSAEDPAQRVTAYAITSSCLFLVCLLTAVGVIPWLQRGLAPAPRAITRDAIKTVLHIGGWNAGATAATMGHRRLAPILMNLPFGLAGNLVLGLALTLTVSVRRLTVGMTEGLDAVSARLSTTSGAGAVRMLMHHSTRLHGFATFPLAALVLLLAEPILSVWLGERMASLEAAVPHALTLIRIMMLGMMARAISDGWIRILYGAGHARRYARLVLLGGLLNPLLFGLLLAVLPEELRYTAVGWSYTTVFVVVHGLVVPLVGARALEVPAGDFFRPLGRPLLAAAACSTILLFFAWRIEQWTPLRLAAVVGLYGLAYVGVSILFVMDRAERARFAGAALRRLPLERPR